MKIFVADVAKHGKNNSTDYHWCEDGEILTFGIFQDDTPESISMCGIKTRKYTTNIVVKDMKFGMDFLRELVTESVERSMKCVIDSDGNFTIPMVSKNIEFNINDITKELVSKASRFEDGQKVSCFGREITIKNN